MSNVVATHFLKVTASANDQAEFEAQLDKHQNWLYRLFELILTEDAESIARLETELEITQMDAVDEFIEDTDWGSRPDLRRFRGEQGKPAARLKAFRQALRKDGHGVQ